MPHGYCVSSGEERAARSGLVLFTQFLETTVDGAEDVTSGRNRRPDDIDRSRQQLPEIVTARQVTE